ncbi:MAG: TRAP transporter substrate-binding protein [Clostridia bacterium]|nr:TRAP transporter substrate-binding protein [Clostridia bacterium]
MKKIRMMALVTLLAATVAFVGCGNQTAASSDSNAESAQTEVAVAAAPIKIVAAHNQTNTDSPYQTGLLEFEKVAEANGMFDVEVHAGTIGTSEAELVEKLKLGAADVVLVSPGFMTKTGIKEIDLFSLPYLFDSYDHWENVVDGDVGQAMSDIIYNKSNKEFKVLGYWTAAVRHYYGKKPLNSIEDIKGMKIRTQTSGAVSEYWTSLGAIPTAVAWGELYQGLQQGIVDAAENAYPYLVPMEHHKTANGKYLTETGHDYTTRLLLVNAKKFDQMTEEQKNELIKAAEASVAAERTAIYNEEESYKEQLIADGGIVNEIDRTPFIEAAIPLQDKVASELGLEELLQAIREAK